MKRHWRHKHHSRQCAGAKWSIRRKKRQQGQKVRIEEKQLWETFMRSKREQRKEEAGDLGSRCHTREEEHETAVKTRWTATDWTPTTAWQDDIYGKEWSDYITHKLRKEAANGKGRGHQDDQYNKEEVKVDGVSSAKASKNVQQAERSPAQEEKEVKEAM
eukprot:4180810-Amphidinium_carterae.1